MLSILINIYYIVYWQRHVDIKILAHRDNKLYFLEFLIDN